MYNKQHVNTLMKVEEKLTGRKSTNFQNTSRSQVTYLILNTIITPFLHT